VSAADLGARARLDAATGWTARLEAHGLAVTTAEHAWVGWRSLDVADPEGNVVELVCHDGSLGP
jgi:hypothetical protein